MKVKDLVFASESVGISLSTPLPAEAPMLGDLASLMKAEDCLCITSMPWLDAVEGAVGLTHCTPDKAYSDIGVAKVKPKVQLESLRWVAASTLIFLSMILISSSHLPLLACEHKWQIQMLHLKVSKAREKAMMAIREADLTLSPCGFHLVLCHPFYTWDFDLGRRPNKMLWRRSTCLARDSWILDL